MATKNILVFGLTDFNQAKLEQVRGAGDIAFHKLIDRSELVERMDYPVEALLDQARERIRSFPGRVDGIVHYIDFPVSTMVPILAREFGLRSASLESVLSCEHKYWSRVEQSRAVPEAVPPFAAFDPFDDEALARLEREVGYPFWVKPIKSFSSYLGFRVNSRDDFHAAMVRTRAEIRRFAEPFDYLLRQAAVPAEIAGIGGGHCIAEGIIGGRQCTLEGYASNRQVHIYGAVDSIRHANRSSFGRYQYPSRLPRRVLARMEDIARRFMTHVGYDGAPFNIEFFWDEQRDRVWLLEVNTRISESHCDLFEKVDGTSNHEVAVDLALGREPRFGTGGGAYAVAGKFFVRTYGDARVERVPTAGELRRIERDVPGTTIHVLAREGGLLSDMMDQDSYTFCLALVFVGGDNQGDILDKFRRVEAQLDFRLNEQAAA